MGSLLTTLDLVIFFGSLIAVMAIGLWSGRKEDTSEDFYLAGKKTRWWGVAGSIFGSNVSANHIVGMMGVGFSIGFAQSHFEISAIAGLLLLCYGFLPVYRKLNVYTLSEYLSRRYDDSSRVLYALIMVLIMVVIQMVPGFYIGSRSLNVLLSDGQTATVQLEVGPDGQVTELNLTNGGYGYASAPQVVFRAPQDAQPEAPARGEAAIEDGAVTGVQLVESGTGYNPQNPPNVMLVGGASFDPLLSPGDVDPKWYVIGILLMAVVTGTYTIIGGLKAVITTDVIQSVLMLAAGIVVAILTFSQPEIGGWAGMQSLDTDTSGRDLMHLFLPSDHPGLPWTGVLSGLMILHFFYWGTNQFIVQRALSAVDDRQARLGIIAAGFFKLLIPFFSIGTGIAAYYYFDLKGLHHVDQDIAFTMLMKHVVAPVGFGLVGIISAGLIGAILSSLDSMMNSAATIVTFDIYQRYIRPKATERELIFTGRLWITIFITLAAVLTIFTMDPNSKESFFLQVATHQSKLVAGVVVAFALGMFWSRATSAGALAAIIGGVVFSYGLPFLYAEYLADNPAVHAWFGPELNFMHSVFLAAILSLILHVVVSYLTPGSVTAEQSRLTWTDLGGHDPGTIGKAVFALLVSIGIYAVLGASVWYLVYGPGAEMEGIAWMQANAPLVAALLAAGWTWFLFIKAARDNLRKAAEKGEEGLSIFGEDRFWGGLLAATAVFMMFYFF